jgi:basic membrane protein A
MSTRGFAVIVAHSFSYQDAVFEVAAEAPETNFAWVGGIGQTAENVYDYDQPFYEPAYLVGILAGHVSQSGHLGALYGFDIPVCHAMGEAMLAGAKTVNPQVSLTVTSVGDWGDVAAAKEAGLAQVDTARVDYWIGCGEGPTLGSIEAALLHTGRPPSSDTLASYWTEPYGEFPKNDRDHHDHEGIHDLIAEAAAGGST